MYTLYVFFQCVRRTEYEKLSVVKSKRFVSETLARTPLRVPLSIAITISMHTQKQIELFFLAFFKGLRNMLPPLSSKQGALIFTFNKHNDHQYHQHVRYAHNIFIIILVIAHTRRITPMLSM